MLADPNKLVTDFVEVALLAGVTIRPNEISHEYVRSPHSEIRFRPGVSAIYIFSMASDSGLVLKVGKVGEKSEARFKSQHYLPKSSRSNLAKSLLNTPSTWPRLSIQSLQEEAVGDWIRKNTDRDHFFLPSRSHLPKLFEAFLHCRLNPLFEE